MTISYNQDLATARCGAIFRTIFRWKGGIWKSVLQDLVVWCVLYAALSIIYRCWLNEHDKGVFEEVVLVCNKYTDFVPLTFMLGYYVTLVVGRWWNVIMNIGFTDNIALIVANYVRGKDETSMMYKKTILRYMCLLQTMVYRAISFPVRNKYPTLQSLVDAGYLEPAELEIYSEDNFWLPFHWTLSVVNLARDDGVIKSDNAVQQIFKACADFRSSQILIWIYNWIPVPLVYTQVVFITVRLYFVLAILGRQFINTNSIDLYVPLLTILQFVFYVGWLKVAECLLNPFGDDDDDFDAEWFLDRNLRNAQAILSENYSGHPQFVLSRLWNDDFKKTTTGFTGIEMTVRYHSDLSSSNFVASTLMLLRWKGSLWKSVYKELILWLVIYAILSAVYSLALNTRQQSSFQKIVKYCDKYGELIPLTFMLGFYVTLVVDRWWNCITRLGFIDNPAIIVANRIRGFGKRASMIRRSIIRYLVLVQLMVYRAISLPARRKYPTLQSLVDAGYLEENEISRFSENNFWICIQWALSLARTARDENIIVDDFALEDVYRVVFITVRLYFLIAGIGRQYIASDKDLWPVDTYVPVITIVQFIFYVGWLKVGEALLNPYGDDDDDFDSVFLLKRNFNVTHNLSSGCITDDYVENGRYIKQQIRISPTDFELEKCYRWIKNNNDKEKSSVSCDYNSALLN